eukprot:TRINITY_DN47073_c0_g1_i1.p1 TRINITY_DN47073_c0_g1~~TRINITY_DN47073_c0_g1_i1.p1  ORF type:complete len:235 (+),score=41.32 TRINITY_DN47073_c0_g1_i1:81-785(+)
MTGGGQHDWAGHAAKILDDLENGHTIDMQQPPLPSRNDLRRIDKLAFAQFASKDSGNAHARSLKKKSKSSPQLGSFAAAAAAHQAGSSSEEAINCSMHGTRQKPNFQRSFGVSKRPPIYAGIDNDLGPGQYDTHLVGGLVWERDHDVSHPAQKQLSQHKSCILASFGKPKASGMPAPKLSGAPGPGHYNKPDLWDPKWQHYPPLGTSFTRQPPMQADSRFGSIARKAIMSGPQA